MAARPRHHDTIVRMSESRPNGRHRPETSAPSGAGADQMLPARTYGQLAKGRARVDWRRQPAARNSSVRLLRLGDVDFERAVIRFRRAKGGKTLELALQPRTAATLLTYLKRARADFLSRSLPRLTIRAGSSSPMLAVSRGH